MKPSSLLNLVLKSLGLGGSKNGPPVREFDEYERRIIEKILREYPADKEIVDYVNGNIWKITSGNNHNRKLSEGYKVDVQSGIGAHYDSRSHQVSFNIFFKSRNAHGEDIGENFIEEFNFKDIKLGENQLFREEKMSKLFHLGRIIIRYSLCKDLDKNTNLPYGWLLIHIPLGSIKEEEEFYPAVEAINDVAKIIFNKLKEKGFLFEPF